MSKPIVSLSEFKARAAQLLGEMKTGDQTIVLTQNGTATAVVQDYASHQRIQEALLMLKLVVQGEADVSAGRTVSQRQVFADIKDGLTASDG
ncbi:MAG: type II toxin-antitoxin system Phd/YefM family antitoxin [Gammaproteobacteria bacterium]|nr:type II toxin-antitoxin system Phd/YefM family antitoxin [Gammaproteobacteria bacterium]